MRNTTAAWAKWLAIGLGGLLALLLVCALILTQLVDPDRYRGLIERQVAAASGRDFRLQGDIQLSFFPWLSLTTGAAELSSPTGFPDPQFLRWREAHIGVRLLPLLRGELIVGRVRATGLVAHLMQLADGRANWDFARGESTSDSAGAPPEIAGIELRDSQILYDDYAGGTRLRLDDVSLDAAPIRRGVPIDVQVRATVSKEGLAERATLNGATTLALGPPLTLAGTEITARLLGGRFPVAGTPVRFAATMLRFDAAQRALSAPAWELGFGDARVRGATTATLGETPGATGTISLAPVSLRATLAAAGIDLPPTRDPAAFKTVKLGAGFKVFGYSLQIDPFDIVLDDTHITGRVTREAGVVHFTLHGDRMDLDRYLKPQGAPGEPFVFPTATLKALQVEGTLDIDEATLDGVAMRGVRLGAGR